MTLLAAERDPSVWVGPGLLGFVVIMALAVAMVLLWRNMNKQIKKVTFDEGGESTAKTEADEPAKDEPAKNEPNGQPTAP
jgi:hypothetical protein